MSRMTSVSEFRSFRNAIIEEPKDDRPCLVICAGTGGLASGSSTILRILKRQILERGLQERISIRITGCQGFCEMDPFILAEPGKHLYPKVKTEDIPRIVDATLEGKVVDDLLYLDAGTEKRCRTQQDIRFFKHQTRVVLGKNETLDPIRIFDYIKAGGYAAITKVLAEPRPEWIIEEVKRSGLRGRGGAGFLTGQKWELAHCSNGTQKYLVCNADEGDPGAYMDRSLLEGNPHAILEGMTIGGLAIGATKGIVYVRTEYPLAIKHITIAIQQARELGLLGERILGGAINFDVEIVRGAGAFVCGEETALIRSIEGRMGEPRQRPPYPIQKGIWGNPTCINNVETLVNIPVIIDQGAEAYAKIGVPGNTGTKIFSLVGKIRNTGLVEVPLGITVGEVVYGIGGGPVSEAKIKAVQTGGPSGGCIPAAKFDLPIDYDTLKAAGTIMGSGGMIVMDENTCMVDVARYFMRFLKEESCGKCFTCRKGTQRMFEILDDISKGKGTLAHLELLQELAEVVKDTTMCGLGQTASNPVLSTLRYFRHEYERHIVDKRCDAFVCKDLVGSSCQSACPLGTEAWRYVAHLARQEHEAAYRVIREANPFPSVCARVCNHPCEERCRLGATGNRPVAIRALKRFVTDNVDPQIFIPKKTKRSAAEAARVAIVGSGPAGLTAAHYLSLDGYKPTVFETDPKPGGMLTSGIPAYRLRRDVLQKEIDAIVDENVTLKCDAALGRDFTIDDLFKQGFKAVFLALGAHKSRKLNLEGEDVGGVYPAIQFLKAFNLRDQKLAKGRVGVVGGGNSAVDAARVALRQEGVESVTILYRRTRREMPALKEEVAAAVQEGVKLETLVTPKKIRTKADRLAGIECVRNELGELDASGRRRPVPMTGTEFFLPLDLLIVTIGDEPDIDYMASMGVEITEDGTLKIDSETLGTSRKGVFAGGDVVTGPDSVVNAIATGKRAATMIGRFLRGEELKQPSVARLPNVFVEPCALSEEELSSIRRAEPPTLPLELRKKSYSEVELCLSAEDAVMESRRCLRCDLEFTKPKDSQSGAAKA